MSSRFREPQTYERTDIACSSILLPGIVAFIRLAIYVAIDGKPHTDIESWPFASRSLFNCYLFLMLTYLMLSH